jgi:hypothetical protein
VSTLIAQGPFAVFLALAMAHALADFPLQGAYLAKQKNRHLADNRSEWLVALTAHCLIQACGVWLVTGSIIFSCIEFFLHAIIDISKCEKHFGHLTDQILHLLCKLGYVVVMTYYLS